MTRFVSPVGTLTWTRVHAPREISTVAKGIYVVAGIGFSLVALHTARSDLQALGGFVFSLGMLGAPLFLTVSFVVGLVQTTKPGTIAVEDETVRLGLRIVRREDIACALVVDRPAKGRTQPTVEIELTNGDRVAARFVDPSAARSVVEALGFGARGRRVRTALATPTRRLLHIVYGGGALALAELLMEAIERLSDSPDFWSTGFILLRVALSLVFYAAIRRLFDAPTVTVGDDVVRVERGFWRKTMPLRDAVKGLDGYFLVDRERRVALQLLVAERAGAVAVPKERRAAFERGGQPLEAWRVRVAQTIANSSYRGASITAEDARATLKSLDATAEERVGAALALREAGEPPERIRVAAAAFADARLRVAIEAVADGDDARADKALRKLAR